MSAIHIKNLFIKKNDISILEDITVTIPQGMVVALVGPNGAGKSTLIKAILQIEQTTQGMIEIAREGVHSERPLFGYVPQSAKHLNTLIPATVSEVLSANGNRTRYTDALTDLGVTPLLDRKITELSGGQLQRVLVARALLPMPRILILDEPTTALDPSIRSSFFALLRKYHAASGSTIIFVTHDTGMVSSFAQELLYLNVRMIFQGSFGAFCASPAMTSYFGPDQHLMCHQHVSPLPVDPHHS